jgi:hypothetical protein
MIEQRHRPSRFTSNLKPKQKDGRRAPFTASERSQPVREAAM